MNRRCLRADILMGHDAYRLMSCSKAEAFPWTARREPVLQTGVGKGYVGRRVSTGWSACYGSIWNRRPRNAAPNPRPYFPSRSAVKPMARKVLFSGTEVLVPSRRGGNYRVTVTDSSAGGGIRSVTSDVFFEWMVMRFTQSENMPFE